MTILSKGIVFVTPVVVIGFPDNPVLLGTTRTSSHLRRI